MNVGDDWPSALIDALEKALRQKNPNSCYLEWFRNSCEFKGLFDVEGELGERIRSLCTRALQMLSEGTSVNLSAQILILYATYEENSRFASSFTEVGEACISFMKSAYRANDTDSAAEDVVWNLLESILMRLCALEHIKSIKRGGSALAVKVGNVCRQCLDQKGPSVALLCCLKACLVAFPGSMKNTQGYFSDALGDLLMKNGECQYLAAECFARLARISGSSESWSQYGQILLRTMDKVLHELLEGLGHEEDVCLDQHATTLPMESDGASQIDVFSGYLDNLHGLSKSLQSLITGDFPSPVPLPIVSITGVAQRALSVDVTSIRRVERVGRTTGQVAQLGVRVSEVQIMMVELLTNMIVVCQSAILPHLYNLGVIIGNLLESVCSVKSHASADITDVEFVTCLLRAAICITQVDGVTGTKIFSSSLLKLTRLEIYMDVDGNDARQLVRRPNDQDKSYHIRHQYASELDSRTSMLQTTLVASLEMMLLYGVAALDHKTRICLEDIVLHISRTTCDLVHYTSMYTKSNCVALRKLQCAAFKALSASVSAPCAYRPAHAAQALHLFQANASSSMVELSGICALAISRLENSMHPRSLMLLSKPDAKETKAREEYGMPSYWSFLEYDGTIRRYIPENGGGTTELPHAAQIQETSVEPKQQVREQENQAKRKVVENTPPQQNKVAKAMNIEFKIPVIPVKEKNKEPEVILKPFDQDSEDSLPDIDSGSESDIE